MKANTNFFDFIQEDSENLTPEETGRLQDMGLEEVDPQEAWEAMTDEWYADPEVDAALTLLKTKLETVWDKYYRAEYEQEWDQLQEWTWEAKHDEIGAFDHFLINR